MTEDVADPVMPEYCGQGSANLTQPAFYVLSDNRSMLVGYASAAAGDKPNEALEDVFWALLNSKEFFFNH